MHLDVPDHGAGEIKDHALSEEDHSHEVASHSPLQVVEEDTQQSNAEVEAPRSAVEPTKPEAMPSAPAEPISEETKSDLSASAEPSSSEAPAPVPEVIPTTTSHTNEVEPATSSPIVATELKSTIPSEDAEPTSFTPAVEIEPKTTVPAVSAESATSVPADVAESITAPLSATTETSNKDIGDV